MKERNFLIYTDGGARGNPGPAAAATVIEETAGNARLICGKYLGVNTNNFAEYQGVILAYETLSKVKNLNPQATTLKFFLDSTLVVNQLNLLFKVKNPVLIGLLGKIKSFEKDYKKVSYTYIPREKNWQADKLVNETLDKRP